ncbi:MAG: hypothetical protein JWN94_1745 [Betaproteobacteria bacterium]|nr:hypothetical protein [Betaproteobacteria bacterium]
MRSRVLPSALLTGTVARVFCAAALALFAKIEHKTALQNFRLLKALTGFLMAGFLLGLQVASAAVVSLPEELFGHLDQKDTNCASQGCGPTAVLNSFVYLQLYYGGISASGPKTPAAPTLISDFSHDGLVSVANTLGTLMECCALGTRSDLLAAGKKTYLSGHSGGWDPMVDWNQTVTSKWLTDNLKEGVDVELLVTDGNFTHYITVTGYTNNTLSFIDPKGGQLMTSSLSVDGSGRMTLTNYDLNPGSPEVPPVTIDEGFSERLASPVPEPATYALLMAGFALLGFAARHREKGLSKDALCLTASESLLP